MKLIADGIGKKFGKEWIFRNFSYEFEIGKSYAITGSNGSGKSTLLKVLAGMIMPNEGEMKLLIGANEKAIENDTWHKYFTWAGPYTELVEEMSLNELVLFYHSMKPLQIEPKQFISDTLGLEKQADKLIKNYSSGMKQKVKMGLALFSGKGIVILDEPTTNFDTINTAWYIQIANKTQHLTNKCLLIASNQPTEYNFCDQVIHLGNYK